MVMVIAGGMGGFAQFDASAGFGGRFAVGGSLGGGLGRRGGAVGDMLRLVRHGRPGLCAGRGLVPG